MRFQFVALTLALGSCAVPPPGPQQQGPARELAGRIPGPARSCVSIEPTSSLRVSENDRHTLLYGGGNIIWANHLGRCGFSPDDLLVSEPFGSNHCRGDIVRSLDRTSHIPGPACVLGDFVPYRR